MSRKDPPYQKVGISMPASMVKNLDYIVDVSNRNRSAWVVELLQPILADMAVVAKEFEEMSEQGGFRTDEMSFGKDAISLMEQRYLEATKLVDSIR